MVFLSLILFNKCFGRGGHTLAGLDHIIKHFDDFLGNEWHRPCKDVHIIRQYKWMPSTYILLYVEAVVHKFYYCSLVSIDVTVVGRWKNGDNRWKIPCAVPCMHFEPLKLGFVCTDYGEKTVLLEKLINSIFPEKVRASTRSICLIYVGKLPVFLTNRVGPDDIAE